MNQEYGIIFFYFSHEFLEIIKESEEGKLVKIPIEEIKNIEQFDMNFKFIDLVFEDCVFEGNFKLDQDYKVKHYQITKI